MSNHMGTSDDRARKAFAIFQERVKRTVFIDNLAPQATAAVIQAAVSQFGKVLCVSFIPNYLEHQDIPQCVLVEMENPCQAAEVVYEMTNSPFMICGMPKPVRALPAKEEMFSNRPRDRDRKILALWLDPSDPQFVVGQKLKCLFRKHSAECATLLKYQLEEEEKLENSQKEMLKAIHKKYETIRRIFEDGSIRCLAKHYKMNITDAG